MIVRPHPRNAAQWAGVELDDPQAVVWPRLGEEPLESESRKNYFDSIYHSAAVVGINTSAQIESAVVGRPVHTVLADEFKETQQGTLHFQYLKDGHLWVGRTLDEHLDQLEESLRGREDDGRNERFLLAFVRPRGLDVAATPLYVETLEELGSEPRPEPERGPAPAAPAGALAGCRRGGEARRRAEAAPSATRSTSCASVRPESEARARARSSPGPGSAARSRSSSTGSRSCAGRRPRPSACATG